MKRRSKRRNKKLKKFAHKLRSNQTKHELLFRKILDDAKLSSHFTPQKILCGYIPDFQSKRLKLIVEIDGGYHTTALQRYKDEKRTFTLNKNGWIVLRFTNTQVEWESDHIIGTLKDAIKQIDPQLLQVG